jgi:hypothetical protein
MKKVMLVLLLIIIVVAGYFVMRQNTQTIKVPASRASYKGDGIQFQYPKTLGANVWKAVTRPPVITVIPTDNDSVVVGCPMLNGLPATKTEGTVNGIRYTLYTGNDI